MSRLETPNVVLQQSLPLGPGESLDYNIESSIFVTTEFIGFHRFPDAHERFPKRAYLESVHRHKFHVRLEIAVTHDDRELEYHEVLDDLNEMIRTWQGIGGSGESCEMMAQWIRGWAMDRWPNRTRYTVTVSEDGENGSTIEAHAFITLPPFTPVRG